MDTIARIAEVMKDFGYEDYSLEESEREITILFHRYTSEALRIELEWIRPYDKKFIYEYEEMTLDWLDS